MAWIHTLIIVGRDAVKGMFKKRKDLSLFAKIPNRFFVFFDKTPWIMKQIFDSERLPSTPYTGPMTKKGFFKKYEFVYDEYYDCIICPNNEILTYSTTDRDGYRQFKSNPTKTAMNLKKLATWKQRSASSLFAFFSFRFCRLFFPIHKPAFNFFF